MIHYKKFYLQRKLKMILIKWIKRRMMYLKFLIPKMRTKKSKMPQTEEIEVM